MSLYYEQTATFGIPIKTGYNFTNWSATSGTLDGNNFKMDAQSATVSANYTPKNFSVTFNANGGSVSTGSKTVTYDSTYGDLPVPTYLGYKFKGWYTLQNGGTQVTSNTKVNILDNQTLYAKWEKVDVTVTFDSNSRFLVDSASLTRTLSVGDKYGTLPTPTDVSCNWPFDGWYTEPSGAGTKITADTIVTIDTDHTLNSYFPRHGWC